MKRIMKRAAGIALAAALVVTGIYCGGTDAQAAPKAKKITMNKKNVNLTVGGKYTLKVKKVTPKKAGKAVTYKTSNKKIATVSKKGVIKGKKAGKATITVTSKANKKAKAKVTVTVRNNNLPVTSPTPTVTPPAATTAPAAPTNAVVPSPTPTNKPAKTTRPPKTPTPIPTEKPKADTPDAEVLDVMAVSELDLAEGIVKTDNEDGSVTIDFSGTSYKGARWYFIDPATKDAEEPTRKALNLEKYTYVVVEGVNQTGVTLDDEGKGHDLNAQFLDALDKNPDHGGELEIETQKNIMFPIKFDLVNDNRVNVAAFEIYSLGDAASAKAGPITVTSIKAYKDKEAYDKIIAGGEQTTPPDTTQTPDFSAVKISAPVTVDGTADDVWADVPELPVSSRVVCDNEGDSTTTATAKLAWDDNNLYGIVNVKDADIDAAAANPHQRDGVEFFLDEDNSMDKEFSVNTDAFQYRITGFTKNEDGTAKDALTDEIAGGSDTAKKDYEGIETAYSFTADGYVVEFKIPFKAAKKAGDLVGFDVIVQDCKAGGRDAEIYLRKTDKALSYWNLADTFGTLKLEDNSAQ